MFRFHGSIGWYGLGVFFIALGAAAITLVFTLREVDRVVVSLRAGEKLVLGKELAKPKPGKPQTLMLIGSDRRPSGSIDGAHGERSDTIILVRLDPKNNVTSLLSLPRDLQVNIPGHGVGKINEAYSRGGTKLTLQTVKSLLGIKINHVINVDFRGFQEAVNAIGCVYVDIDQRYFNNNASFAAIDIQPGYQRLCGGNALDYVRYRHTDNDLVRSARQQDFLRQARQQVGAKRLVNDRVRLIKIFGKHTRSDIESRKEVLRLVNLAVASIDHPIQEIHFQGQLGPVYVTSTPDQIKTAVRQFFGERKKEQKILTSDVPKRKRSESDAPFNVEPAADFAKEALSKAKGRAEFPVMYPKVRIRGSQYPTQARVYTINAPRRKFYRAYRLVARTSNGEYYGLQGTQWKNPPILAGPSRTYRSRGRKFQVYYDGKRVRLVAWKTPRGAYWISNTLLQSIKGRDLLEMARSTETYR